jgi:hypothetical protein
MRKALNELDAEERDVLLYLADLGTAMCSSALIVTILQFVGGLFS